MVYTLDTEFNEKPGLLEPISIGLVAEDGRTYYAESNEFKIGNCNEWVKQNVIPKLKGGEYSKSLQQIKEDILEFVSGDKSIFKGITDSSNTPVAIDISSTKWIEFAAKHNYYHDEKDRLYYPRPEFWAYYADYDWVGLCWMFGTMMDLPKGFPMYCRDLKQEIDRLGLQKSDLPKQSNEHSALDDALWNMKVYKQIVEQ